jgi:hypothetical protein
MAGAARAPRRRRLAARRQFRIVPSRFPPITLFERLVSPDELEVAYAIESLTNDRLRAQAGDLHRVPRDQWVTGPGASVVMAPFTHIGRASRFSDGSYGVYYAALEEETAIAETAFHVARFLRQTREPPIEVDQRLYIGNIVEPLDDVRGAAFERLSDPDLASYPRCQAFGKERRAADSWGLLYRSARRTGGTCIGAFRPKAVTLPTQSRHFRYLFDGERVVTVLTISEVRELVAEGDRSAGREGPSKR